MSEEKKLRDAIAAASAAYSAKQQELWDASQALRAAKAALRDYLLDNDKPVTKGAKFSAFKAHADADERRQKALAMRQAGESYAAIGRAMGVSGTRAAQMVTRALLERSRGK